VSAQDSSAPAVSPGILIVDDEPGVVSFLEKGLRQNGFTVWPAHNGLDALEIYETHRKSISAVLMDVLMVGLDGPATLRALRSMDSNVRCCYMSGGAGKYSKEELLASGASYVLSKPFALSEAVGVLGQMVRDSQTRVA
jgi:CheY-like chemotaxis protein